MKNKELCTSPFRGFFPIFERHPRAHDTLIAGATAADCRDPHGRVNRITITEIHEMRLLTTVALCHLNVYDAK